MVCPGAQQSSSGAADHIAGEKRELHMFTIAQAIVQKYLAVNPTSVTETSELGASVAQEFGRLIGPVQRHLSKLPHSTHCWPPAHSRLGSLAALTKNLRLRDCEIDSAKALAGQLASKSYFAGESAGVRLAHSQNGTHNLFCVPWYGTDDDHSP